MNILLTCVGRRSYIVDYFKDAVGDTGKIIGTNSIPDTSGMFQVDRAYTVPNVNDSEYIPTLVEICRKEDISLIISLFDIDLPFLAASREIFKKIGVEVVVSDPEVIDITNDKWKTFAFLSENFLPCPKTFLTLNDALIALESKKVSFPMIIKPRWGMGSIAIKKVENKEELSFFYEYTKKEIIDSYLYILSADKVSQSVVIQEFIDGEEYGVDVFNSLDGNHISTVVKQKLAMRAGETDIAITVDKEEIASLSNNIGKLLRHRGNLDIDILLSSTDYIPYVLDLNARFGGGYPFSHIAGVNFPKILIDMVLGRGINPSLTNAKVGIKGLKFIVPKGIS